MPALLHSPAEILASILTLIGVVTEESADSAWPVFISSEPDSPDNAVTINNTAGIVGVRSPIDGEPHDYFGVSIRIRATTDKIAYAKAQAITEILDKDIFRESTTIESNVYCIHAVHRTTSPVSIGKESPTSKRSIYTINALLTVQTD